MVVDLRNRPRGIIQRSYPTEGGKTMWLVAWQHGHPSAVASDERFQTGQAVFLTSEGELRRVR